MRRVKRDVDGQWGMEDSGADAILTSFAVLIGVHERMAEARKSRIVYGCVTALEASAVKNAIAQMGQIVQRIEAGQLGVSDLGPEPDEKVVGIHHGEPVVVRRRKAK